MANLLKKLFGNFDKRGIEEIEEEPTTEVKKNKPSKPPLPRREEPCRPSQKSLETEKKVAASRPQVAVQERTKTPVTPSPSISRPTAPTSRPIHPNYSTSSTESVRATSQNQQLTPAWGTGQTPSASPSRPQAPSQPPRHQSLAQAEPAPTMDSVRITIRYPQRYEDATAIVDLLLQNETLLIDFEYMDEAQARRCIDFLDGASRVLFGSLQRVGGTLYLLAPRNVVVTAEEIRLAKPGQDQSYDYDMKRR